MRGPADAAFPALKRLVIARTGHAYYEEKDAALWERLRRRILASGAGDAANYLSLLERDEAEWNALEAEVTIGETFFFRDAAQFDALRDTILPALIAHRAAERRLRIWSAGCSSGAEAYSVAILLRRLLGEAHRNWRISILGTDINERALATARAACFSPWALRGMTAADRDRDFLPAEGGRSWQLRPEHRTTARFERGNLLDLLTNSLPAGMAGFDLILCRNVLIYLARAQVSAIVRALGGRLAQQGWMLLGHSEPDPAFSGFLRPVSLPGTIAWRPLAATPPGARPQAPPLPTPAAAMPVPRPASWPTPRPAPARTWAPGPPLLVAPPPAALPGPSAGVTALAKRPAAAALDRARAEADSGALESARATLREALREHPTTAALHHLDGLVARALGDPAAAEAALRRALYLDSAFVAAHYHLGLLLLDRGAAGAARRSIANAGRLAGALPGETPLEEGDGMTAETLLALTRRHLAEDPG